MTKSSGVGAFMLIDGDRVSNDIGQVSRIACPVGQHDVTGLDSEGHERTNLLRDGAIDFAPHFNPASGQIHDILAALPTTDRVVTFGHRNLAAAAAASLVGKQANYDGTRPADGSIGFTSNVTGNSFGLDWGRVLTPGIVTSTGAENLASIDLTDVSTDFGLQAYLHVLAFTGTDITVTIEDSADDAAFAAVAGAAFTAATDVGAQRIETSRTENVRRYLRCALTGTYTNAQILVVVNRNLVQVDL